MRKNIKNKILDFLKQDSSLINAKILSKRINISYPTILKYLDILKAEGKITLEDFGNMKVIRVNQYNTFPK